MILTYRRREVKNLAAAKEQYITTDYAVDTAYRHFVQRYDRIAIDLTDLLEGIADKVDNTYVNEFLTPTVTAWTTVYDPRDIEPNSWQREWMVAGTLCGSVVQRMKTTCCPRPPSMRC